MNKSADLRRRDYTNRDIVTMAVYQLGGALRHIHVEDVAMKAAKLSPRRFCWKKYPDQINLESVRISLKNELALPDRRVLGSIRDGWMLTPHGLSWCLTASDGGNNQSLIDELHREIDRAKKTSAFGKTISGRRREVSVLEVEGLVRVNSYFTARDRRERILALANAAVLDPQLRLVLTNLREQGFKELEVKNE
jgi:hypothetical protein